MRQRLHLRSWHATLFFFSLDFCSFCLQVYAFIISSMTVYGHSRGIQNQRLLWPSRINTKLSLILWPSKRKLGHLHRPEKQFGLRFLRILWRLEWVISHATWVHLICVLRPRCSVSTGCRLCYTDHVLGLITKLIETIF